MKILERLKSEDAYMGVTHALSALAVFLLIIAFIPAFSEYLKFNNIWFVIIAGLTTVGAATSPDLDNTKSTIKSSLGVIGSGLSTVFRASSVVIQSTVRTRKDDSTPDPHRGFWHTIIASLLLGTIVYLLTGIGGALTLPVIGSVTIGYLIGFIFSFVFVHLALVTLIAKFMKKIQTYPLGKAIAFLVSFIITVLLFMQLPTDMNFIWLGVSVALGMIIHILGDTTTTSGTPLLWPLPIRGKMWYTIRLTPMKAGGDTEKLVLVPTFVIISAIAVFFIIKNGTLSF